MLTAWECLFTAFIDILVCHCEIMFGGRVETDDPWFCVYLWRGREYRIVRRKPKVG